MALVIEDGDRCLAIVAGGGRCRRECCAASDLCAYHHNRREGGVKVRTLRPCSRCRKAARLPGKRFCEPCRAAHVAALPDWAARVRRTNRVRFAEDGGYDRDAHARATEDD